MILLATDQGIAVCGRRAGSSWEVIRLGLSGMVVTCVIARDGAILAGTRDGIFKSEDYGETWKETSAGLNDRIIRWMSFHPYQGGFELAGTEPAGIYVSQDGGEHWSECAEVAEMRERFHWYLPYSPEAGCVRGFAHHGDRAYAAVEVGGVLVSEDGGGRWALAKGSPGTPHSSSPPSVDPDVHSILVHPSTANLVYAPTGGGFYRSADGGDSWELLYRCYCRAAWVDPTDPGRILLGPADGVDRNGRIELSTDGGRTWNPASTGMQIPWQKHMVERFTQVSDELFAVLSNGDLLSTPIEQLNWRKILPELGGVSAVAEMQE